MASYIATRIQDVELEAAYDLEATASWVTRGGYTRVALQMPDEALGDSAAVAAALSRRCRASSGGDGGNRNDICVFVLADTTFGGVMQA